MGIVVVLVLVAAGTILAERQKQSHRKDNEHQVHTEGLSASAPSIEYIYAGSRLVATEEPPGPPLSPSGLTASTVSTSQINLSWTDNSNNETGFKIERKTGASGTYAQIATAGANVTSYSDTGLSASTTYYYRVRATNTIGDSAYSGEANATTSSPAAPAAPSGLTATAVSSTQVNLNWTDNSSNELGFKIFLVAVNGPTLIGIANGAGVTSYSVVSAPSTTTCYQVAAFNLSGDSALSNEACATTPGSDDLAQGPGSTGERINTPLGSGSVDKDAGTSSKAGVTLDSGVHAAGNEIAAVNSNVDWISGSSTSAIILLGGLVCLLCLLTWLSRGMFRPGLRRSLASLVLMLDLMIWPGTNQAMRQLPLLVSASLNLAARSGRGASMSFKRLFKASAAAPQQDTLADRLARVSRIQVAPHKLVAYIADAVTFVAMGADALGQPVHGAKFTWESSDTGKLTIDEAGRATCLQPGLVLVTAHAGLAAQTAPVLIRAARRPLQTDAEWRADQDSLVGNNLQQSEDGNVSVMSALMDRIAPTAYAQSGQGSDYGNATWPGQVGTPPFTALEDTRLGPVMPQNNFELPIPLVNLGGRGLATSLTAYYNSNVWGAYFDPIRNGTVYVFDPIQGWPGPGFSLDFGRIVYYNFDGTNYTYMLIDPNGTRHVLGSGPALTNSTLQTTDGTHITFVGNAVNGGTLYSNDGTKVTIGKVNNRLLPTQITDTNGNYVQVAYISNTSFPGIAINYIVDTLGRVIQFNYGQWPAPTSTSLSSISTPTCTITFSYQNVTLNYNFLSATAVDNAPASFYAVSGLTIPQRPTYSFSYSGYGMIYSASAASAGGTATVTYDYPLGGEELNGGPTFTQRTESPNAVYNYTSSGVTRPDGTKLFLSGPDRQIVSTTNTTLAQTVSAMTTDPGGSSAIQSVVSYDDIGQQTKVDFDYDQYGNVVNKREYGYQINGAWQVRRRTAYSYVNWEPYMSAYIRNRVTEVDVFDALQNTNDADDVLIGKTGYGYDGYYAMGGMENYGGTSAPPGHLSSYDATVTARGDVTHLTSYSDVVAGTSVTRISKLDIFGGVTVAQLPCCNQKSFTMTEATYWSRPSQTTSGDTSGVYLSDSAGYDFNTLNSTSQTDPDNQTTTYGYDAWGNPNAFTAPSGASGSVSYNAWGTPSSSSVTYSDGGVNKTISTSSVYDGWGQMTSSVDANGAQTNYTYDSMGRLLTRTNPFPQGGAPGPVTTYQYDQLGRATVETLPDGNTNQTSYSGGNIVTVTDQVGRKIKRESDGLGRLIKVTEQDVSTGALTQDTTYTYDIADHLTGVNQGGQTRAFKYDSAGRLLFERIPEQTATINDGTGTMWSCKYTYTNFNAVATKQDARGVIATYGYDSLNRLTSISYNVSGAPGVASTPSVTYNYDNNQSSDTKGLLLSVSAGSGYSESHSYSVATGQGNGGNRVTLSSVTHTIDGNSYTTSYQFNTANQLTQLTYASGRVINIGHDSRGRMTSVGLYLTSVTYSGIGQMTGMSLGNGVTDGYDYDTNRMQLTSQTATKGASSLMNLSYGYQAAAGQMGAGSTAGNAGQLTSISGTINGTTESAGYTYDDLGRLITSNQMSNGSSAQRRFVYDRWGNRTGEWDATSGGTQIQSIALAQSGGAPTNQIASLTGGASTVNYSYDAAGNVTNDGSHTYQYDAENRLVSVDGGATGQYSFDQQNRRVKKVSGGNTTFYIWEGNQVIAEYSNAPLSAPGGTRYYEADRLSTRLATDSSGKVIGRRAHLPFGEDFAESGSQEKHHFTSYERDGESGLDYAVNRFHNFNVGRFSQVDPKRGGISNPQTLNRYAYVTNDPINRTDPLGLCPPGTTPDPETGECVGGESDDPVILSVTVNSEVPDWGQDTGLFIDGGFGLISGTGFGRTETTEPKTHKPDKAITNAVDLVRTILSTKNPCSDYFGANAIKALNAFEKILTRGNPNGLGDTQLGIKQSGPQTTYEQPTQYRTFQNAVINNSGPFFNSFSKTRFGGYDPGSHQSQVLQILHELAHLVYSGGAPLIPDDSGPTKKVDSEVNTGEVLKHCKGEIDKVKN